MEFSKQLMIAATISLVTMTGVSFASGSFSSAGSSGVSDTYNQGKIVVHKKIICATCPLKSNDLDKNTANNIATAIAQNNANIAELSPTEKKSALVYLSKRFDIQFSSN